MVSPLVAGSFLLTLIGSKSVLIHSSNSWLVALLGVGICGSSGAAAASSHGNVEELLTASAAAGTFSRGTTLGGGTLTPQFSFLPSPLHPKPGTHTAWDVICECFGTGAAMELLALDVAGKSGAGGRAFGIGGGPAACMMTLTLFH